MAANKRQEAEVTMTTRSAAPLAKGDKGALPLPDASDDTAVVVVATGSPAEPTPAAVATRAHFRVLDDERTVLYLPGVHVPATHLGLPWRPAVLLDGTYVEAEVRDGEAVPAGLAAEEVERVTHTDAYSAGPALTAEDLGLHPLDAVSAAAGFRRVR